MDIVGKLSKMQVTPTFPVSYSLPIGDVTFPLNNCLGKKISLHFLQQIQCMGCGVNINKSYQEGYCFPCTQKLARCDLCIVKPERCHFHLGSCREPLWGERHCMIPHLVYLAYSSNMKVGITRKTQSITRWIDQGATETLPLFEVMNRRISGLIEITLAKHISDKTNWRKMLSESLENAKLEQHRMKLLEKIKNEIEEMKSQWGNETIKLMAPEIYNFTYPVLEYPKKIVSLSFEKTPHIEGTLLGMKGQYLIFDRGVMNIRKHTGYILSLTV